MFVSLCLSPPQRHNINNCFFCVLCASKDLVQDLIDKSEVEVIEIMKSDYNVKFDSKLHARQLRDHVKEWHFEGIPVGFEVPSSPNVS